MTGTRALTNPAGANTTVTTFLGGRDAAGFEIAYEQETVSYRVNAAVTKGQPLMWVAPTATVPLSVTPMTVAGVDTLFVGAALESRAAGQQVLICKEGICEILVLAADTPAFGEIVNLPAGSTPTGRFETAAAEASTLSAVGVVLSAELGGTGGDTVQAYISRNGINSAFVVDTTT